MKFIANTLYRYLLVVTTFFAWHWLTDASASLGQGLLFGLLHVAVALAIGIGSLLLVLLVVAPNREARESFAMLLTDPFKKKEKEGLFNE